MLITVREKTTITEIVKVNGQYLLSIYLPESILRIYMHVIIMHNRYYLLFSH